MRTSPKSMTLTEDLMAVMKRSPFTTAFIILVVLMFASMALAGVPWTLP